MAGAAVIKVAKRSRFNCIFVGRLLTLVRAEVECELVRERERERSREMDGIAKRSHACILCGMYFGVVEIRLALNAQRHTICQDKQLCRGLQITFYYYDLEMRTVGGGEERE